MSSWLLTVLSWPHWYKEDISQVYIWNRWYINVNNLVIEENILPLAYTHTHIHTYTHTHLHTYTYTHTHTHTYTTFQQTLTHSLVVIFLQRKTIPTKTTIRRDLNTSTKFMPQMKERKKQQQHTHTHTHTRGSSGERHRERERETFKANTTDRHKSPEGREAYHGKGNWHTPLKQITFTDGTEKITAWTILETGGWGREGEREGGREEKMQMERETQREWHL